MQTKKNWQLLALILPLHLYGLGSAVEFEQCIHTLNNSPCNMTCKVPDFDELIEFTCNGTTRGSCSLFLCDSNMIKEGNDTMQLQLTALSYSDNCRWICTYNGIPSSPSDVKIYSGVNVRPVLTIKKTADEVELKATAECIYPYNPTVVVQYKDQNGGDYMFLSDQTLLRISNVSENCSSDIEKTITAIYIVSGEQYARLRGKSVLFKMTFTQYPSAISVSSNEIEFSFQGLTTPSSTFSSDMSETVSELSSTFSSDLPTTVSEASLPPITTSSTGLSQEIVIAIVISSALAAGLLILLVVLVVRRCRQQNKGTAKNKENYFANKQGNFTKKDASKSSIETKKSKFSGKRNTKQESVSLDKFKHTQFKNSEAPKDRMYEHYPQTTHDYMYLNNRGNQHVFNHSHAERNMILYGSRHDNYLRSQSRPNHRMVYLSPYPEHPGHNEGMFQYYRANNLYQGQQMYQRPYVAQYDHHIKDKQINERSFEGRTYERNWDFLY